MDSAGIIAVLLVGLRIAPTLAFAPPFTLFRIPAVVRVLLSISLAAWIVAAHPTQTAAAHINDATLLAAMGSELMLGISMALALQLAFAAMQMVGRTIDFQVGFGLAVIADPTLRTQLPLIGALFAYAAGAVFFATDGPSDLLAVWSRSLDLVPIGGFAFSGNFAPMLGYISAVFGLSLALAGFVLATLFLIDLAIALMSRTLPQMNVLVLGFQVKTLALLLTLPFVFAFSGSFFLRILRLAVEHTGAFT